MIRDSDLRPNEKLIMLALLDRADNDTCMIPAWRSPSLLAVEQDTSLSHGSVVKLTAHLELHGWLRRDGQKRGQMKGSKHSGRGKSATRWTLLPVGVAMPCACKQPDRSPAIQSEPEIGQEVTHLDWSNGEGIGAGQGPDWTKGGRDEGSRGMGSHLGGHVRNEGWPEGTWGESANEEDQVS